MTADLLPYILLIGGGSTLMLIMAFFGDDNVNAAMKKRLLRVGREFEPVQETKASISSQALRRRTADSDIALVDRLVKKFLPNPDKLRQLLARTGKNLSVGEYVMIHATLIPSLYLLFYQVQHWSKPVSMFVAIMVGLYVPHTIVGRMGDRRLRKFLASFPEAIDTICRGLRAGLPITESIGVVGNELPDPVGIEFRRISDSVRMGKSLEDSMWEVSTRLDTPEFRFFIIALAIQRETGGNLAETLGNLAELLRRRRQLRMKIRAMSSEAKASAMIIGSLPFLMFGLLMVVSPEYVMILLNDPRGKIVLGFGVGWLGLGILVMKKMISFQI